MDPKEQENLVNTLHKKEGLSSLRTYQGDMATFIQSKDQSLADLALKNREGKDKKQEKSFIPEQKQSEPKSKSFLLSILGILLLIGSATVMAYLGYIYYQNQPVEILNSDSNSTIQSGETIPIEAATLNKDSLISALSSAEGKQGIAQIAINVSAKEFLNKVGFHVPSALERSLEQGFIAGTLSTSIKEPQFFLILKVKDYGIAYRDMLVWENEMPSDFTGITSASTADYQFTDLVVKNKDTRSYANKFGKVALIYTFLNSNTILITESESALTELVNTYVSGNVSR
jgi:hypothetical protein